MKFLALALPPSMITDLGWESFTPKRTASSKSTPSITYLESENRQTEEGMVPKWKPAPKDPPGPKTRTGKMLVTKVVVEAMKTCVRNHTYLFNGDIRKQIYGGSIGSEHINAMARVRMIHWDWKYLETLRILIMIYDRYVDDTKQGVKRIKKGTRFGNGTLTWSKEKEEEDKDIPDDVFTFSILQEIANTISPTLKVTFETPSQYPNGKLPLLDTQIWVEDNMIKHEYFEKKMTSKYVIMASSAHPERMKRAVLVEEGMRRMRNFSPDAPWSMIIPHMEKFAWKMMISGYPQTYRGTIVRLAVERFFKSRQNTLQIPTKAQAQPQQQPNPPQPQPNNPGAGEDAIDFEEEEETQSEVEEDTTRRRKHPYRNKRERICDKLKKGSSKDSWFDKQENIATLQVPATPGGVLAKLMRKTLEGCKGPDERRRKVVEESGI